MDMEQRIEQRAKAVQQTATGGHCDWTNTFPARADEYRRIARLPPATQAQGEVRP